MGKIVAITGNSASAQAMRQINPDVCAAYPITPSTQVMEEFSQYVADGKVNRLRPRPGEPRNSPSPPKTRKTRHFQGAPSQLYEFRIKSSDLDEFR